MVFDCRSAVCFIVIAAWFSLSCGDSCPAIACVSSVVVNLPSDIAASEPEQVHVCINDDCLAVAWPRAGRCEEAVQAPLWLTLCRFEEVEARLILENPAKGDVISVVVQVAAGNVVLADGLEVSYHKQDANGEECPGSCQTAEVKL